MEVRRSEYNPDGWLSVLMPVVISEWPYSIVEKNQPNQFYLFIFSLRGRPKHHL